MADAAQALGPAWQTSLAAHIAPWRLLQRTEFIPSFFIVGARWLCPASPIRLAMAARMAPVIISVFAKWRRSSEGARPYEKVFMRQMFAAFKMTTTLRRGAALALLGLAGAVAAQAPAAGANAGQAVIANGPAGPLTRAEVESMVRDLVPEAQRADFWGKPESVSRFARSLYAQRMLAAEAVKAGIDQTPEGTLYLKLVRERGLAELLMRQREQAQLPDDKALDAYARSEYQAHPERFKLPEQVHARHILLAVAKDGSDEAQVKAQAEKLMAELRGGADFATLAQQFSVDKGSAARGGDLGEFGPGKMVPAFDAAVFALKKPGELAGPVRTPFGYHIIELVSRQPARAKSFEQVLPELRQQLRGQIEARERLNTWNAAQEQAQVDDAAVKALSAAHVAEPGKP